MKKKILTKVRKELALKKKSEDLEKRILLEAKKAGINNQFQQLYREVAIKFYVVLNKNGILIPSKPHGKQNLFHADSRRIRVVQGGNRSGKSACGINEDVAHSLGYRYWLKDDDPYYKVDVRVPNTGLIVGESFSEQIEKVINAKLLGDPDKGIPGAIPPRMIRGTKKNHTGVVTRISLTNGSKIFMQSYDQDADSFESADYDWIHYDEPPPREIWVATQRGLTDRLGRTWLTMTPIKEPWIYDEIVSKDYVGKHRFDIEDNCGYGLTRQGIDGYAATLTAEEKESRLRGRFFHLTGLVYKDYTADVHRIKRQRIESEWNIWMHIDTHPRTPHHVVWIAILPDNKKFIVGELKNGDPANRVKPFTQAIKTYEDSILQLSENQKIKIRRLIDPSSCAPNPVQDGTTIEREFFNNGIYCKKGSKHRDSGILLMKKELAYNRDMGTYPNLYVFDDLIGIDYEFTHYIWDDYKGKLKGSKSEKQNPVDKDDHYLEGSHRILLANPIFEYHFKKKFKQIVPAVAGSGW